MTVKEAIKKAKNEYKGLKVWNALETEKAYIFGFCGEDNEAVDISPCIVDKSTGVIDVFFPPEHLEELGKARKIDLTEI